MSDRSDFESAHIYSTAANAAAKRKIDEQIMGGDYSKRALIDMSSEAYLKELIRLASKDKRKVKDAAGGLQFFIVKGGVEGFFGSAFAGIDASRFATGGSTTSDSSGVTMVYDCNDLLAVFDKKGKLIGAAALQRPISIVTPRDPHKWREVTAEGVYKAWDGGPVSLYRNTNYTIKYFGLMVNDKEGWYRDRRAMVDIHKQEATNGCIFIVDPSTPAYDKAHPEVLNAFEPQLIKDIQKTLGKSADWNIGTMNMVEIN